MTAEFQCRVYFEDTDAGGVVYNANYLKFYERARTEFLRALGYEQDDLLQQNIVFVVRRAAVDFLKAARFNDMLTVKTRVSMIKKTSVIFDQEIFAHDAGQTADTGQRVNHAEIQVVCVQADNFRPSPIPGEIFEKLSGPEE